MDDGAGHTWSAGRTALLITVPEADPLVTGVREKYDPGARNGVPAHVTVLYPFLPAERIDGGVLVALRELFTGHQPFELDFTAFGRFPDLLWLAPEPQAPLRALTAAVTQRWPDVPPYGGAFGDAAPHLSVASGRTQETYEAVEREFTAGLPLRTRVAGVHLAVSDGERWRLRETFPLGAPGTVAGV